ncbi:hypothetical protein [Streptomyces sp. NBC_00872]|nr:hypothetical protein OG214_15445 [Streptomyces sp. NBC_00872]
MAPVRLRPWTYSSKGLFGAVGSLAVGGLTVVNILIATVWT